MSKKAAVKGVKKSKRRLKRSVRRSLAAVLMITAIGIAAVPVPENLAEGDNEGEGENQGQGVEVVIDEPAAYNYNVDIAKDTTYANNITSPKASDGKAKTSYPTYTVRESGSGYPRLIWQYKYFRTKDGDNNYGIISGYNSKYLTSEIKIDDSIITEYVTVSIGEFNKWFSGSESSSASGNSGTTGHNSDTYTCTSPGRPIDDAAIIEEYFPNDYKNYVEEWNKWNDSEDKVAADEPKLTKTVGEMSEINKQKYYCDNNDVSINNRTVSLKGFRLIQVIDEGDPTKDYSNFKDDQYVYIPQQIEIDDKNKQIDANGYLSKGYVSINGIGDEVFKGVQNVTSLLTSEDFPLNYIGVSTFEDSYIQNIDISNVTNISDRAFKGCHNLNKIAMGQNNRVIGTEAFYDTRLTEIKFAKGVTRIGAGSFAECTDMQKIDFSALENTVAIDKYAFYNTSSLTSIIVMKSGQEVTQEEFDKPDAATTVKIDTIGDGAFAVKPASASLTMFTFPSMITKQLGTNSDVGIGDCILAGRSGLQYVTMPNAFGQSVKTAKVPEYTFYNCFNLKCVKFPDNGDYSCSFAAYDSITDKDDPSKTKQLFASVNAEGFYVKGPKMASGNATAYPRRDTWTATTGVSNVVPYLYIEGGKKFYEVSNGTYLMCINDSGYLTSCTLMENAVLKETELEIPSEVGTTKVVGIGEGCFSDPVLNNSIKKLTISDDSISEIANGVFKGWKKLEKVYIGNSVNKIGDEAFKDCKELYDVTFSTPADYSAFTIGKDAFLTNGTQLTFHGDIVEGYAPFEWAMAESNIINTDEVIDKSDTKAGVRVCYKSLAPSYLTVMYNPITELVTLLDYPKYDQISNLLYTAHEKEILDAKCLTYEEWRVETLYAQYREGEENENKRKDFAIAWNNSDNPESLYTSDLYGPWVNPEFCGVNWTNYKDLNASTEKNSGINMLTDWLFEPIVAYAADTPPKPYYTTYKYDIAAFSTSGDAYRFNTPEETSLLYATEYITVPAGVGSIDVYGYYKNLKKDGTENESGYNTLNVNKYLTNNIKDPSANLSAVTQRMYFGPRVGSEDEDMHPGLFSGKYDDKVDKEAIQGNDRIRSVILNSVEYLPDYAFDNCERLELVQLGSKCSDIGVAPFRDCLVLKNVNANPDYYVIDNGIIYAVKPDGTYRIEECLAGRGTGVVGQSAINLINDPNLAKVSEIQDGAFEGCSGISTINLDAAEKLRVIPERCFRDCDNLNRVDLPEGVNNIKKDAFTRPSDIGKGPDEPKKPLTVTILGREVQIATDSFDPKGAHITIRTYDDTSAYRYADYYDLTIDLLDNRWTVTFYDIDGTILGETRIDNGLSLKQDQFPVIPEDWRKDEGLKFTGWQGAIGSQLIDNNAGITGNATFLAQYDSLEGMVNGKYVVDFYTVFGDKIETKYVEPGGTVEPPVNLPQYEGYIFSKWTPDTFTNIQSSMVYIAGYEPISGSGPTSGNSTNTSGSSTNNNKSSNSTNNASNSSSSTSATSTSSSAAGKYTVTVVNGSGSGTYDAGSTVIIAANTPASGKVFSKWTTESQGVTLASVSLSATTFVMPANNVTVTANYIDGTAAHTIAGTVNNGNTGNRNPGNGSTTVSITKPGISNKDLATANVNGSTDNFVVKISETDEATQAVINALTNKYGNMDSILYYAMDISLYDSTGTVKINDTSGLSVDITIPIPDALTVFGGNNMAGAVVSNQLEDLSERFTTINGVPCISFTATHFSPYTIYVNTQNLSEGMLDVTPKTGDPIHPKWFLSLGLACISIILFMKKDKRPAKVKTA